MKKAIMITTILMSGLTAMADDYGYLTFEQQDGTKVSLAASGLTITFADGQLKAGDTALTLADLSKMYFTTTDETTSGIEEVTADRLTLQGATEVYDLNGRRMASTDNLPKGVYIIKGNGKTTKILVR